MYSKKDFEKISIRGRLAFGVNCIIRVTETWGVKSDKMNHLILELLSFTHSEDLSEWEDRLGHLFPKEESMIYAKTFGFEHLSSYKREELFKLIVEVYDIGAQNLYGGFRDHFSLNPLMNVIRILNENDIPLPDIGAYRKSKVEEEGGWGYSIDFSSDVLG
ncbi:hypothetical protein [Mechercharimyces sp. CAU 1602]|uniref:hypothetical protein n=1 Tax=Mechercharimyces sp. CAU 1602 TaxID=2973933 RepID=UPI00216362AC|nr:hypothetical protein [Mechercharimyces sp. CAU 1602]MCS1350890.1 hypothetical protein [Mechercharimyces sp. CAU 1602]